MKFRFTLATACLNCAAAMAQSTAPPAHKETVVVTGTADPIPLDESDRSVDVIGNLRAKLLLFGNLGNILQLDSSVDLQQRASGGVQGDISIRGGTFGQTLVLLNGMRLNDVQSGHHNFDVPAPLDAIGRIEILHGSGSTLYGSDAVGGVVNVLTRADEQPELVFRSAVGSFGTNTESGRLSFSHDIFTEQLSFGRELSDGFEDDREYRNLSGSSETLIRTSLGTTRIFLSALDRPFGANQFYGNYNSWERTKTWFALLQQDLGRNTSVGFSFRRHTDLFELLRDNPALYTNRHADETWDLVIRRHNDLPHAARLLYGVEAIDESIQSNNLGNHRRAEGAGYGVLDFRALHRFSLSLGAREEFFGRHQAFFAPTISGGAWLSEKVKLRASVSRAFRRPTFTDLYYQDPADIGNPNLKPEEAWNFEGGIDWHLSQNWRASATVFDRTLKNGIDYVRSSLSAPWMATNFDRVRFLGVETSLSGSLPHSQQVSFQYTALHGTEGELNGFESKYLFNYPVHEAIATWQILAPKGIIARTRIGALQRYGYHPYGLWDIYLGWTRYRVRPYLQATNITNTRYQEITGVDMPGRAALVGVEISYPLRRSSSP